MSWSDLDEQAGISRLKKLVTGRSVPAEAAAVSRKVLLEGVLLDFPVNDIPLMGGPVAYQGDEAAVV